MGILDIIRSGLVYVFSTLGIRASFHRYTKQADPYPFDRNCLESYYTNDKRICTYYEGLSRCNQLWTDNLSKQFRFYSLQQLLEMVISKDIAGDIAECGCWKGHSSYLISRITANTGKQFHIFDSFEGGLSPLGEKDTNLRYTLNDNELRAEKQMFSSTEDEVKKVLKPFGFVKLYKGWIPERFPDVADHSFSLVHVDVDLYQPTYDSFNFFFERLSPGGAIVCDDYGLSQFAGCKKAVDQFLSETPVKFFYQVPSGGCFVIK